MAGIKKDIGRFRLWSSPLWVLISLRLPHSARQSLVEGLRQQALRLAAVRWWEAGGPARNSQDLFQPLLWEVTHPPPKTTPHRERERMWTDLQQQLTPVPCTPQVTAPPPQVTYFLSAP